MLQTVREFLSHFSFKRRVIVFALMCNAVLLALSLLVIRFTQIAIAKPSFFLVGILALLIFLTAVLSILSDCWYASVANDLSLHIREKTIARFLSLPYVDHKREDTLLLKTVMVQNLERIDDFLHFSVSVGLPSLVIGGGIFIALLFYQPLVIFSVTLLVSPLFVGSFLLKNKVHTGIHAFYEALVTFSRYVDSIVSRMTLIKYEDSEHEELLAIRSFHENIMSKRYHMIKNNSIINNVQNTILSFAFLILSCIGMYLIHLRLLTLPELVTCLVGFFLMRRVFGAFLGRYHVFVSGLFAIRWINDFVRVVGPALSFSEGKSLVFSGHISVKNLEFSYSDTPLFKDLSFSIEPRKITALTGPNGAGKTTVLHLILGLLDPLSGDLYADGISYRSLNLQELRKHISILPQEPIIVEESSETLGHIMENGQNISGGQKQSLMFQRALAKPAKVYIFDEPTNHMDIDQVKIALSHITRIKSDAAIILISHDPDVVAIADVVVDISS